MGILSMVIDSTKECDSRLKIQNSEVTLIALTSKFASSKDPNPTVGYVSCYGIIEDIIEVDFWSNLVLFYVDVIAFMQMLTNLGLHKSISRGYAIRMILLY